MRYTRIVMVGARKAVATAAVFQSVPVKTDQVELDLRARFYAETTHVHNRKPPADTWNSEVVLYTRPNIKTTQRSETCRR